MVNPYTYYMTKLTVRVSMRRKGISRRDAVKFGAAAATFSIAGLAGCSSDADQTVSLVSGPSDSAGYAMAQGKASVINENTNYNLDTSPGSSNANVRDLAEGEVDIAFTQGNTASALVRDEEPFDQLDVEARQLFHIYSVEYYPTTDHESWDTWEDIESGSTLSVGPAGSGVVDLMEAAFEIAVDDYDVTTAEFTEQASSLDENRLDTAIGALVNETIEPGWIQENKGVVDLRALDIPDSLVPDLEESPLLNPVEVDTSHLEGWGHMPDSLTALPIGYSYIATPDLDAEIVYDLLEALYDNTDDLASAHAMMEPYNEEFALNLPFDGMPFHTGAAEFYEDRGVWDDDLEQAG